ncbi:homoserine O-acetyltransferase MetA [Chelativorans sp. YIM 93263]|uniref:homoserine O-acetyltransferase MetA n=1 Tax=Chelativorans sp. YIM 93263 TaxID=2906648 RepID=UPI0023789E34|nr:homoserine O-succinyltransferase [Chelativorans sp. YIM 93263]
MPIKIPDQLPARDVLVREGVSVMDERTAMRQDIRPMQIGLLNLMPNKSRTETQIARLIGTTPLQVELTLVRVGSHKAKNTSEDHLIAFYQTWEEVADRKFDGFIITGAPVELLPFEEVTYWEELTRIFEWTTTNVHSSFFICWGAMAAARHFHGIPTHTLEKKAFGVFRHRNNEPASPYLAGFSDDFAIPVSRWTEIRTEDIPADSGLKVLMESEATGPCLFTEATGNRLYMLNHIEYDSTSLKEEYERDRAAGAPVEVPHEYFPENDPARRPLNRWRSHAHLLFGNWINQVYQTTPYDIDKIGQS